MAQELDANNDGMIDTPLLGTGTPTTLTFLRGDQAWAVIWEVGATAPADTAVIWGDTSGV